MKWSVVPPNSDYHRCRDCRNLTWRNTLCHRCREMRALLDYLKASMRRVEIGLGIKRLS